MRGPAERRSIYGLLLTSAVVVGFVARLAFAVGYWNHKPLTNDEQEYLLLASSLANGHGYQYPETSDADGVARFGRAPGYPAFLAGLIGPGPVPETVPGAVKVAQSVAGAIGVLLIGLIAGRVANHRAALWAAWIAALYPPLVWISAYALSEALYSPMILGAVLLLGGLTDGRGRGGSLPLALVTGVVLGLSALVRPAALVLLAFSVLWLIRRPKVAAALALGGCLVVAPWTARNARVYGRLVPIASEGGITFWTGNHPLSSGEGDMAANPALKAASLEVRRRHPGAGQEDLEPVYYREAFQTIKARPIWWLGLLGKKFFYLWVPVGPSYTTRSARYYGLTLASYGLLLPFGVAGAVVLLRRRDQPWALRALWLAGASSILVPVLFLTAERFRIPVIDPLLIVCASAWCTRKTQAEAVQAPVGGERRG